MAWNEPGSGKPQDPWGNRGRKPQQGGQSLEDVLNRLGDRLSGLFGGGKKGAAGSGGAMLGPIAAVALVIWALMGTYKFDAAEQGVVLRFGKYHNTLGAGLHWQPWLIDEVRRVNVAQILQRPLQAEMITSDQNLVNIQLTVQYLVGDARAYLLRVESAEDVLGHAIESAMRHVVGNSTLNQVLNEGRANLAIEMKPRLQGYLNHYQTGLSVSQVNIIESQPPRAVGAAFLDVVNAKEDKERLINDAKTYANGIVPEARGRAQRMLQEAEGYRQDITVRAEGDAARFNSLYAEYRKAPKVTRDRIYIETMQNVYSKSSKIMLDTKGNNMIYLPLEQVMNAKAASTHPDAAAVVSAAAAADSGQTPAAKPPERAADRLRSRREETR